jgi:IclR family acetate operon transcriptional repressor
VNPLVLQEEIRRIQKQGYAFDDEETEIGGRCVAAPVFNKQGHIEASVSIVGPSTRIRQSDLVSIATVVKRVADQASAALGFEK